MSFIVATAGIIRNCENQVLTLQAAREQKSGLWEFPGGKLNPHEDPIAGVQREIFEECGLQTSIDPRPLRIKSYQHQKQAILVIYYLISSYSGKIKLSSEHQDFQWVTWQQFSRRQTWDDDATILRELITGQSMQ